jgi:poly(beta-D-mannuronate) lyase
LDAGSADIRGDAVDVDAPQTSGDARVDAARDAEVDGDMDAPLDPTTSACDRDPASTSASPPWGDPMPACIATYDVATQAELDARLGKAIAGDCIVVGDGTYAIGALDVTGNAARPIVVRAQHRGKTVIASGTLTTSAKTAYLVLDGFDWTTTGSLRIDGCDHCRLTRNRFRLTETADMDWIVLTNTNHVRIDHNEIGPKAHTGNPISIFGTGGAVARNTRIDHNHIHDLQTGGDYPSKGCGFNPGGEAIRVGVSGLAALSSATIIEHNLFERCDGDPETISTKTSDNVVRYNTFRSTAGSISLRVGDRGRVCGNFVFGGGKACSGGIRLIGEGHAVYDNYVEGVDGYALELHAGDPTHPPVANAVVVFNTFLGGDQSLYVGGDAKDCVIANNIFTAKSGTLIRLGGTAAPPGLVAMANLAPLGAAKLGVGGAPWTAAFLDRDPSFVLRGELSVLGPASTNAIGAAEGSYPAASVDIDGQARDDHPDIGADELSTSAIERSPLTPAEVGPGSP